MVIYLVAAIGSLLFGIIPYSSKNSASSKIVYLCFVFVPLILIAGFRAPSVGSDTAGYIEYFHKISGMPWAELTHADMEIGYTIFNKIIACFTDDAQILLFLIALITLTGFAIFIYHNSIDVVISTFLFITIYQYCTFLNAMRQYIAVMLICNSYTYLKNRKLGIFVLLVCIAGLFHISALLFLPMAIFALLRPNIRWLGALAALGVGLILLLHPLLDFFFRIFPSYAVKYLAEGGEAFLQPKGLDENILIWLAEAALVILSAGIMRRKTELSLPEQELKEQFLLSAIMLISIMIGIMTVQIHLIHRFNYYFFIFLILAIPRIFQYCWGRFRIYMNIAMVCCLLFYFFVMLHNNNHEVIPYQVTLLDGLIG